MTGLAYYGAADRYLGKLAEVRERPADAIAHLEAALTKDEAVGWPVWAVHSRYELGRMLAERVAGKTVLGPRSCSEMLSMVHEASAWWQWQHDAELRSTPPATEPTRE